MPFCSKRPVFGFKLFKIKMDTFSWKKNKQTFSEKIHNSSKKNDVWTYKAVSRICKTLQNAKKLKQSFHHFLFFFYCNKQPRGLLWRAKILAGERSSNPKTRPVLKKSRRNPNFIHGVPCLLAYILLNFRQFGQIR